MHLQVRSSMSDAPEMTVLAHDVTSRDKIPSGGGVHVIDEPRLQTAERARNVFVLVAATDLAKVSRFVSLVNRRRQLRALFVRDDLDAHWLPQLFERAGLRTLRNTLVHSNFTLPRRVLAAWIHGAQEDLIADARVANDRLFVTSCTLKEYDISVDEIPSLSGLPKSELTNFEIDEDGSYIHWPGPDIHLDLETIRAVIDPSVRQRALIEKLRHERRYGQAIATFRAAKGLKQSEIDSLSERQVRRIEKGAATSYAALDKLARAHGMNLSDYLDELARIVSARKSGKGQSDRFEDPTRTAHTRVVKLRGGR